MDIAIIKGILSCESVLLQNETFLWQCFQQIITLCKGSVSFHYMYYAFCTLEQLFSKLLSLTYPFNDFNNTADMISMTTDIVWLNWYSPVRDIPQIIMWIFSSLLHIWHHFYKQFQSHDIIPGLLRLQRTTWYVRGQYGILSALLPYVNIEKILDGDIRSRLLQCMSTNYRYMAPCGSDAFKSFLLVLRFVI